MKPYILKQLWNMRKNNIWIFLELVLVAFFLWSVIDPVYVIMSNKAIDAGYNIDQVLLLKLNTYSPLQSQYKKEYDTDSINKESFLHIYDLVRNHQSVESAAIAIDHTYPESSSINIWMVFRDTTMHLALRIQFYQDGDYFDVFRIPEVNSGSYPKHRNAVKNGIYITKDLACKLSSNEDIIDAEINKDDDGIMEGNIVLGVVPNFKLHAMELPLSTTFLVSNDFSPQSAEILFRIRNDVPIKAFIEQFNKEFAPLLRIGNFYPQKVVDLESISKKNALLSGYTSRIYMQIGLSIFLLLCTFLGVAGNFWLRSDTRKSEIGLRIAMGNTKRGVIRHFLTESFILTTAAWLLGVLFSLQRVYAQGFAEPPRMPPIEVYLHTMFVPHFLIVSLIVYALMLFTTLIGTLIPAWQATQVSSVDALRDE